MYIDDWWGDYIGSSADSAVLLRYFEQDGTGEYPLSRIFTDFNLYELIQWGDFRETEEIGFTDEDGRMHPISSAINLAADLAAIQLESLRSGSVSLTDLDEEIPGAKRFVIQPDEDGIDCLVEVLRAFADAPEEYDLAARLPEHDLREMAAQCRSLADALEESI